MKAQDKVIVVTGGGNGIGSEVVLLLLQKKAKVVAVDLNQEALNQTKELAQVGSDRLMLLPCNISDKEAVLALPEKIIESFGQVDGLFNIAGIIQPFVKVNELDFEKIEKVMNVNFYGTLFMVKAFLPYFLKRPQAHIVNISSMGGFIPVPGQTIYGASKAAVKLLTEGLHSELMDTNVNVTIVFPGGVSTDISKNSEVTMTLPDSVDQSKMKLLTPIEAASLIVKGMENNAYRVVAGKDATMMDRLYRLMPQKAASIIAKQMASLLK